MAVTPDVAALAFVLETSSAHSGRPSIRAPTQKLPFEMLTMDDRAFYRGARIKPKPTTRREVPINEELSLPEFIAYSAIYLIRDYKVTDKAKYLEYCSRAFDAAVTSLSAGDGT